MTQWPTVLGVGQLPLGPAPRTGRFCNRNLPVVLDRLVRWHGAQVALTALDSPFDLLWADAALVAGLRLHVHLLGLPTRLDPDQARLLGRASATQVYQDRRVRDAAMVRACDTAVVLYDGKGTSPTGQVVDLLRAQRRPWTWLNTRHRQVSLVEPTAAAA